MIYTHPQQAQYPVRMRFRCAAVLSRWVSTPMALSGSSRHPGLFLCGPVMMSWKNGNKIPWMFRFWTAPTTWRCTLQSCDVNVTWVLNNTEGDQFTSITAENWVILRERGGWKHAKTEKLFYIHADHHVLNCVILSSTKRKSPVTLTYTEWEVAEHFLFTDWVLADSWSCTQCFCWFWCINQSSSLYPDCLSDWDYWELSGSPHGCRGTSQIQRLITSCMFHYRTEKIRVDKVQQNLRQCDRGFQICVTCELKHNDFTERLQDAGSHMSCCLRRSEDVWVKQQPPLINTWSCTARCKGEESAQSPVCCSVLLPV